MNLEDKNIVNNIETRLKTIMIGSLARFEDHLGYLWNIGDEPNTSQEHKIKEQWEDLREDILNHGNNQIRLAINNLLDYIHHKNKFAYSYNFIIDDSKNKNRS